MTDFFGGLTGGNFRFTDARIGSKDGPLPTSLSGPEGINGDPDGKYNFTNSLLEGITPYAYGQGRMGSDRNYQQIPNRKQFPIPPLWLPEPDATTQTTFQVSHPVDMGDLAFIMNVQFKHFLLTEGPHGHIEQGKDTTLPQWNVFCNICTVNYILAGLHNYAVYYATATPKVDNSKKQLHAWFKVMQTFNIHTTLDVLFERYNSEKASLSEDASKHLLTLRCKIILEPVVRLNMIPIGICSMSEKQGGQHEVGLKPVQAAASFFTTLTVDGQNRDLVNIWRALDLNAGDFLTLQLQVHNLEKHRQVQFVLNHYYKGTVAKTFVFHEKITYKIQLVPAVSTMEAHTTPIENMRTPLCMFLQKKLASKSNLKELDVIMHALKFPGYWHIGQTYTKKTKFSDQIVPVNDTIMTRGQLLQINFAPVWKGISFKPSEHQRGSSEALPSANPMYHLTVRLFAGDEFPPGILSVTNEDKDEQDSDERISINPSEYSGRQLDSPYPTAPSSERSFDPDFVPLGDFPRFNRAQAQKEDVSKNITLEKLLHRSGTLIPSAVAVTPMNTSMDRSMDNSMDKTLDKTLDKTTTTIGDKTITSTRADAGWSFEEEMEKMLAEPSLFAEPSASSSRRLEKTSERAGNKKPKNA